MSKFLSAQSTRNVTTLDWLARVRANDVVFPHVLCALCNLVPVISVKISCKRFLSWLYLYTLYLFGTVLAVEWKK